MKVLGAIGAILALIVIVAAIGAFVTQWAWGIVIVPVFGLPPLTLIQAFALNLLASFLIKSSAAGIRASS